MTFDYRFIAGVVATLGLALISASTAAEAPLQLRWKDLVPARTVPANPFKHLTEDQRYELGSIVRIRGLIARRRLETDPAVREEGRKLEEKLTAEGLDVEALLAKHRSFKSQFMAGRGAIKSSLHDKTVKVPGYLLPLNFDEAGVEELLLVPYVGACIHTPPPPPNQIIYVRTATPFKVKGLYTPVWVTGRMSTKPAKSELSFVDGRRQIEAGYTIADALISSYRR